MGNFPLILNKKALGVNLVANVASARGLRQWGQDDPEACAIADWS